MFVLLLTALILIQPCHSSNNSWGLHDGDDSGISPQSLSTCASLWTGGVVPFIIRSGFSTTERAIIQQAMDDLEMYSPIRFIARTSQSSYLDIGPEQGNFCGYVTALGSGSPRILRLNNNGACFTSSQPGTVYHEFLHAFGMVHEQTRTGRDECIDINLAASSCDSQYSQRTSKSFGDPYDYTSVMHYSAAACGNGQNVMTPKQSGVSRTDLGQRIWFTQLDINKLNRMYGTTPPDIPDRVTPITCSVSASDATNCGKSKAKGACFHGSNTIVTPTGKKLVKDVKLGDLVLSAAGVKESIEQETRFERVFLIRKHWPETSPTKYVKIESESGEELILSPEHLMYVVDDGEDVPRVVPSELVSVGQYMLVGSGESGMNRSVVVKVSVEEQLVGAYSFDVEHGKPLVSGILVSSYTTQSLPVTLDRIITWPVRIIALYKHLHVDDTARDGMPTWLGLIRAAFHLYFIRSSH